MFSKIAVIASLLFFLFGTNVFANSHSEESTSINENVRTDHANVRTKKTTTIEPSFKDYVVPVSVGLLFIIGLGSYWFIYRRKHA
ncbi:hypothetical protein RCG19_14440 [Neobacillus sp. OS1-2]|uniref:hypothetical protein n=1 Tax=Neobacillus sp. OS1-2 TaxID=3070680 RepID=UPI0027E00827|nr:hypothetical protein [Neobacillus sp. OS1-2]WML38414.1 hypothetical protein RCG19_14440 [Neobacillus sp. OS1-2]